MALPHMTAIPDNREQASATMLFWALAGGHIVIWMMVACMTQANAPFDHIEMLYWGHEWQWGYYKHPPLPAWMAEAAAMLTGDTIWSVYALSQLCIVGCFWCAWRIGSEVLRPRQSLAAAILIEPGVYYSWTTTEFNNNIAAKVCWAFFALALYYAVTRMKSRYWGIAGVFLGAALLSKYDAVLLLASCLCFSLCNQRARHCWKTRGPYILITVSALLVLPHIFWVIKNDFATIRYVQSRIASESLWLNHLMFPVKFIAAQIAAVGTTLVLACIALGMRWKVRRLENDAGFLREFLTYVILGPLLLAIFYSACTGAQLRSMWGAAMFTYLGVFLLLWFEGESNKSVLRSLIVATAGAGLLLAGTAGCRNYFGGRFRDHVTRVDFPGDRLGDAVAKTWTDRSDAPLKYVGGDWWVSANVSAYHPLRPSVYADLSEKLSPWVSDDILRLFGGVILWDEMASGEEFRAKVRLRYPTAEILPAMEIRSARHLNQKPVTIGMAVILPSQGIRP